MQRRHFIGGTAAAALGRGLPAPALAQGTAARTLRFVPQVDLTNFDPVLTTIYVVRNAGMLIWDTLYGVDSALRPQRQMVESEEVSADGLTWTFRLRPGLKFHDGTPVLARDAVASIARWSARDFLGRMILARQQELAATDDRTFRWVLKQPFPQIPYALGKAAVLACFVMPERIARTSPNTPIGEYVGSGPMRFRRDEWVPGARAVFERNPDYVPRDEPASWLAGGKRMLLDRIEWLTMADAATAAAALQNGEVDWWENAISDLVPVLKRNRNVAVEVADPLGMTGVLRLNHLHPPFNDVRARQALMLATSQEDYMRAVVGDDEAMWKANNSFFIPGTPDYTEAGNDLLRRPPDIAAAKRLLAESGYRGEPVTILATQDHPWVKPQCDVTIDTLQRLGMKVDIVALDWGATVSRRGNREPPARGGWNAMHSFNAGISCVDPATNFMVHANGPQAWFGWPDSPEVEAARAAWFAAPDLAGRRAANEALSVAGMRDAIYVPTGFFMTYQAYRRNVSGIGKGPIPTFWGVAKG
ncbi:ABC transporter substrate-binding protein [Roseomonas sp. NAR14]|uniref:ABC transporter substrate-binding protein n=1 Tax=Roseomonas acroporae TaxID=2937791 RepID=A0A9X1Y583_9PROT|nr:ABC transporter substrate-binding protein [Roseomonas acroporae]MCK8784194.1 ABC transporter substrate-binding protein [Roseomonas acroporae]